MPSPVHHIHISSSPATRKTCQIMVFILTFLSYTCYHLTRKPASIVKSVLDPQSDQTPGWAPFNTPGGASMLGEIDVAFLLTYSLSMYLVGHLGDRWDLRLFLTVGMVGTGVFTALFGAGYWLNIHSFGYYLVVQVICGLFQSTGWPTVLAIVANWFGKEKRGLIMCVWNAHTSVGSIVGALIASEMLRYGWGWSFAVPGLMMVVMGLVVLFYLPDTPHAVGVDEEKAVEDGMMARLVGEGLDVEERAVGFVEAWRLPGVLPFGLCLFFSKLVAYTFLYWLPFYISHTAIDGKYLSDSDAGVLSTLFDLGGVLGGILAGYISDRLGARAIAATTFTYCTIPVLLFYRLYGSISIYWNISLMLLAGMFVNGPCALITTAVSADLGTHVSLQRNSRALATVSAIINGTGSIGAAAGPLLAGYISNTGWDNVFAMLMVAAFVAGLLLTKLVMAEVTEKIRR